MATMLAEPDVNHAKRERAWPKEWRRQTYAAKPTSQPPSLFLSRKHRNDLRTGEGLSVGGAAATKMSK